MRNNLRILAKFAIILGAVLALGTTITWLALGGDTGWTKTYIEIPKVDEITGIEYTEEVKKFVPGLDFLVAGAMAGFVCIFAGISILKFFTPSHKS